MIYEFVDIVRTIDEHIDQFEAIGILLKEKNGHLNTASHSYHNSNSFS
jgi:hypothetical protein